MFDIVPRLDSLWNDSRMDRHQFIIRLDSTRSDYSEEEWNIPTLRVCLECGIFFPFLRFFCEIELIPVKFLCDSCKIPAFQTDPKEVNITLARRRTTIILAN